MSAVNFSLFWAWHNIISHFRSSSQFFVLYSQWTDFCINRYVGTRVPKPNHLNVEFMQKKKGFLFSKEKTPVAHHSRAKSASMPKKEHSLKLFFWWLFKIKLKHLGLVKVWIHLQMQPNADWAVQVKAELYPWRLWRLVQHWDVFGTGAELRGHRPQKELSRQITTALFVPGLEHRWGFHL